MVVLRTSASEVAISTRENQINIKSKFNETDCPLAFLDGDLPSISVVAYRLFRGQGLRRYRVGATSGVAGSSPGQARRRAERRIRERIGA